MTRVILIGQSMSTPAVCLDREGNVVGALASAIVHGEADTGTAISRREGACFAADIAIRHGGLPANFRPLLERLYLRLTYGGKKGRAAARRLHKLNTEAVQ